MKLNKLIQVSAIAATTFVSVLGFNSVDASTFTETEIDQEKVTAIARPFGGNQHDLLIIEQIADKQDCWQELESSSGTVVVEPLLLNFDFTGICQRSTDSNGYSIRVNGQDLGMDYMLNVVPRDGELVLVGVSRSDRSAPELLIGSTKGMSQGFLKIHLYPGWRFTRRTYEGKVLGHIYLSTTNSATDSQGVSQLPDANPTNDTPGMPTTPTDPTLPTEPTLPTQPGTTTIPTTTTPTDPNSPTLPTEPDLPTLPTEPDLPTLPTEPDLPTTPGMN